MAQRVNVPQGPHRGLVCPYPQCHSSLCPRSVGQEPCTEPCGGLDGTASSAGTLRGCLSKQLPPGSPDTLPWCGLSEHLITLISCSVQSSRLADKHTEADVFLENRSFLPTLPRVLQRLPPDAPSLAPGFYLCLLSEVEERQYNLASKQLKLKIFFCNLRKSVSVEEQVPGTSCCPGAAPY